MYYLESFSFRSREEYEQHEPERVEPHSISLGELYTFMGRLEGDGRQAIQTTVEVVGNTAVKQLITVRFLNDLLETAAEIAAAVDESSYVSLQDDIAAIDERYNIQYPLRTGYLRDYYQGTEEDRTQLTHLSLLDAAALGK